MALLCDVLYGGNLGFLLFSIVFLILGPNFTPDEDTSSIKSLKPKSGRDGCGVKISAR